MAQRRSGSSPAAGRASCRGRSGSRANPCEAARRVAAELAAADRRRPRERAAVRLRRRDRPRRGDRARGRRARSPAGRARPGDLAFAWTGARATLARQPLPHSSRRSRSTGTAAPPFASSRTCPPYSYAGAVPLRPRAGGELRGRARSRGARQAARRVNIPRLALLGSRRPRPREPRRRCSYVARPDRLEIVCDRAAPAPGRRRGPRRCRARGLRGRARRGDRARLIRPAADAPPASRSNRLHRGRRQPVPQ